jgi:hypothetical protein
MSTDNPVRITDKPVKGTDKPVRITDKPVKGTPNPADARKVLRKLPLAGVRRHHVHLLLAPFCAWVLPHTLVTVRQPHTVRSRRTEPLNHYARRSAASRQCTLSTHRSQARMRGNRGPRAMRAQCVLCHDGKTGNGRNRLSSSWQSCRQRPIGLKAADSCGHRERCSVTAGITLTDTSDDMLAMM